MWRNSRRRSSSYNSYGSGGYNSGFRGLNSLGNFFGGLGSLARGIGSMTSARQQKKMLKQQQKMIKFQQKMQLKQQKAQMKLEAEQKLNQQKLDAKLLQKMRKVKDKAVGVTSNGETKSFLSKLFGIKRELVHVAVTECKYDSSCIKNSSDFVTLLTQVME